MAKRRDAHDEELPFVALMDTMTNVVGVLIIVLVMIAISLASSVEKVLSELPEVTAEQLKEMLAKVTEVQPKEDADKMKQDIAKIEDDLKKATESLKTLDTTTDKQQSVALDPEELQKQLEERKKERVVAKGRVEKALSEVDRLKALLDTTPVQTAPPATVVKLPNPRPIPENAVMQRFLIANNRIIYLNDANIIKTINDTVESNKRALTFDGEVKDSFGEVITVMRRDRKVPKTFYDQAKVLDYFAKRPVVSRDVAVTLVPSPNSSRLPMRLLPKPEGGESLADVSNPNSTFQRAMRALKQDSKTVIWFHVVRDSLTTYLAARDMVDAAGIPAGWSIQDNPYYQVTLNDFEVNFVPGKPSPPPGFRIAAPKATLD